MSSSKQANGATLGLLSVNTSKQMEHVSSSLVAVADSTFSASTVVGGTVASSEIGTSLSWVGCSTPSSTCLIWTGVARNIVGDDGFGESLSVALGVALGVDWVDSPSTHLPATLGVDSRRVHRDHQEGDSAARTVQETKTSAMRLKAMVGDSDIDY